MGRFNALYMMLAAVLSFLCFELNVVKYTNIIHYIVVYYCVIQIYVLSLYQQKK